MSLLHDALKKAEKTSSGASGGQGVFLDSERSAGSSNKRIFVLSAVASLLLLFVTYQKFVKKPAAPGGPSRTAPVVQSDTRDGGKLLEEAQKLIQQGRYEDARGSLEKAVFTALPDTQKAEAYNNLGFVLKKLGRTEEAFQRYQKALALDPQCAECRNNLGVLYLSNRDFTEAETHFQEALKARPDYAEPHLHLALLLEARGDYAGAKKRYLEYTKLARGVSADFLVKIQERIAALEAM